MSAQLDNVSAYLRMSERDLDSVVAIEEAVHAHPWTRGNFADSIAAGYHCWVAYRGGALVGYFVVMIAAGEAHLLNLSVAKAWHRHHIGTELTGLALQLARDCGVAKIYLEVRPSNIAARTLYAEHGFAQVGTRRDYYPAAIGREDAMIMELQLK